MRRALVVVVLAGCSFVGVRAPARTTEPAKDPAAVHCSDSGILPALDALGGAAAISVIGGGVLLEHTSDDGEPEHFTRNFAGPLLAVAIAYFWSASFGTDRIERCSELKEQAATVQTIVRPITP
jgi:hypothetical protein